MKLSKILKYSIIFSSIILSNNVLSEENSYSIKAKYDYIRSCPGGGGIFILELVPDKNFKSKISLELQTEPLLNAQLTKEFLDLTNPITEIIIQPELETPTNKTYEISILTSDENLLSRSKFLKVNVEIFNWPNGICELCIKPYKLFAQYINKNYPSYGDILSYDYSYSTYPETIIVEHRTYLSSKWEIRIAQHITISPHDWTMILLRKRHKKNPGIALKRTYSDGEYIIIEIPLDEYPIIDGY